MKNLLFTLLLMVIAGCGPIGIALGALESTKNTTKTNNLPSVSIVTVGETNRGDPCKIVYTLTDPEGDSCTVKMERSDDGR